MNKTWFDKGWEQGEEKGRDEGRRQVLQELLEQRFGPLPSSVQERIFQWPAERLAPLVKQVLHAQSLRELGLED